MLEKGYDPKEIEEKWYDFWLEKGFFHAQQGDNEKRCYSIVIPPPNITGALHMGHALNNTLQDIMIRYKRMDGFNTLWMPGTDHAGIATQNVVEKYLAEKGISRDDLGRNAFIDEVWKWRQKHGGLIISQLKRLGASCDWDRLRFTMDDGLSRAVRKVFVNLYNEGAIYQSNYIVNWCPRCHSALSDLEVEHEEENGFLWYIRYPFANGAGEIVVATTRPETMLGDTAVAVHPSDERYTSVVGKEVILPIMDRKIPVIADLMVSPEFGTGAVKITPAHDLNDFELGLRHDLDVITVIGDSGSMNDNAGEYEGLGRFECRKRLEEDLEERGYLIKKTPYKVPVGKCYRCKTVIEPYLSKQWFVKAEPLAKKAIEAVEVGHTKIFPAQWEKVYFEWMYNIRDWCISRQIWWGHRIPAWLCNQCGEVTVSEETPIKCGSCGSSDIYQDPDVLDTWFSSALWPFSTMGWPDDTPILRKFYPTDVLITGFDILFFWVARMMMMGLMFMDDVPFKEVYLHALVRDEEGQKMSKSKGNIVDPLVEIDKYGADAFRFALTSFAAMGRDIKLSDKRIQGYRFFINKIWNASRFVLSNIEGLDPDDIPFDTLDFCLADKWILSELNDVIGYTRDALDGYRFNDAAQILYHFTWHRFCDWYIEVSKSMLTGNQGLSTKWVLYFVLKTLLELLHPIIPFVTEEIWQGLPGSKPESITITSHPKKDPRMSFPKEVVQMDTIIDVISNIRNIRGESNIPPPVWLKVIIRPLSTKNKVLLEKNSSYIKDLARVDEIRFIPKDAPRPKKSALAVAKDIEIYVPLEEIIDINKELERLDKQINKVKIELEAKKKKLSNKNFLNKAKKDVVEKQKSIKDELEFRLPKLLQAKAVLEGNEPS